MPSFPDLLSAADEASEALRGLAHATRMFDNPAQTYDVLGNLIASARCLHRVLDQLAAADVEHRDQVHWAPDYRMPPAQPYPAALVDVVGVYAALLEVRDPSQIMWHLTQVPGSPSTTDEWRLFVATVGLSHNKPQLPY